MDATTHSRGRGLLPFASLETLAHRSPVIAALQAFARRLLPIASFGTIACSFLAPPDDHFLSPASGGAGNSSAGGQSMGGGIGAGGLATSGGTGSTSSTPSHGGRSGTAGASTDGGSPESAGGERANVAGAASGSSAAGALNASTGGIGGSGGTSGSAGTAATAGSGSLSGGAGNAPTCDATQIPDGGTCRLPQSCNELHQRAPSLASGIYSIQPAPAMPSNAPYAGPSASSPFASAPDGASSAASPPRAAQVYCDMQESGGGWTLILNEGTDFMPKTPGTDDAICYDQNCTSSVYSTLALSSDILLDVADQNIVGPNYAARIRILGVNSASRGKTLRDMFTTGPYFLERGDNTNLSVFTHADEACEQVLPPDFAALVCNTCQTTDKPCGKPILTLGDADSVCNPSVTFAIGASDSESESWTNCAGWPQATFLTDSESNVYQYYPSNMRIWVR